MLLQGYEPCYSITAWLIGLLVLVYLTGRISHGHEITRQRRDQFPDLDDFRIDEISVDSGQGVNSGRQSHGNDQGTSDLLKEKNKTPRTEDKKGKENKEGQGVNKDNTGENGNHHKTAEVPSTSYYTYSGGVAHRHNVPKVKDMSVDMTAELRKQTEVREEEVQHMVDKFLQDQPGVVAPDVKTLVELSNNEIQSVLHSLIDQDSRKKRYVTADENSRWLYGVVPYVIIPTVEPKDAKAIEEAQRALERNTCVKFVPWVENVTQSQYNLPHKNYLRFVNGTGCWSYIGNLRWQGQPISCCGRRYACLHEIGHAFGLGHEQQSPDAEFWTRTNWNNIPKSRYVSYSHYRADTQTTYGHYDTMSNLHYSETSFGIAGKTTWTSLYPELGEGYNTYYEYYDIAVSHNCRGVYCSDFHMTCENDGYATLHEGICTCMCPYGLDRSTGCTTTITEDPTDPIWPGGRWAIVASVDGCPGNIFSKGEVTHWSDDGSSQSWRFHLGGYYNSLETTMEFCVMNSESSSVTWPAGAYCIQRFGGSCPYGFQEGFIQFDDVIRSAALNNSISGTVPDGVYDTNTLFYYCCRDDGFMHEIMDLPNEDPFVLFRYGDTCQHIRGMIYTEEYYNFNNLKGSSLAKAVGSYPSLSVGSNQEYKTTFCYYTPLKMNCGGVHALDSSNPSVVVTSPNYPNKYSSATECNWLFTAPEGSTLLLDFDDFHLEESDGKCFDYVVIRQALLGQPGTEYCGGPGFDNSIRSILNTTSVTFRSDMDVELGGFKMTITAILPEDLCYDANDHGKTYRGTMNFTRNMEPCLPWSELTQCPFHALNPKYFRDGLEGNYCRNPGKGLRPWCYTGYDPNEGCNRNYCDVCRNEKIYDVFGNCNDWIAADATFCEQHPDAFKGCAKTCANSLPPLPPVVKVSEVSCNAPTIPSDGQLVSTPKTSYAVGETVDVQCSSSSDIMTASCLTDGTWNLGPYVCGVCPSDWTPHAGHCYKHFPERVTYADAKSRCAEFGGIIAPTNSQEELEFVVSQRPFMQEVLWLGADDKINEGTWLWQDGSQVTWFNWMEGQPDNSSSATDCACITKENGDLQWKDELCTMYFEFICRKQVTARTLCVERRDDCQEIFEHNQRVRADFPDFAYHECPYTFGHCDVTTCAVPSAVGAMVTSNHTVGGTIDRGDLLVYECLPDYKKDSGDLERACKLDGQLTGSPPVCSTMAFIETSLNDVDIIARQEVGENKKVYSGPMHQFQLRRKGEISQWIIHSKYTGMVSLQIWRPEADNSYQFIGQNVLLTGDNTAQTFDIFKTNRIPVEVNDVIGIYYPGVDEGGVSYDHCNGTEGMAIKSTDPFDDVTDFVAGYVYSFDDTTLDCRLFSINAVISPRETYVENNDREIVAGDRTGIDKKVFTGTVSDLYVPVDGYIAGWKYHSALAGPVVFQVWTRNSDTSFTLVGQNFINAGEGIQVESVPEQNRLRVYKGNYLGILYGSPRGRITMFNCDDPSEGLVVRSYHNHDYDSMIEGKAYSFDRPTCKRFNFKATIIVDEPTTSVVDGIDRKVLIGSGFDLRIRSSGIITAWHYHSLSAGGVAFQIWRRISDTRFPSVNDDLLTVAYNAKAPVPLFKCVTGKNIAFCVLESCRNHQFSKVSGSLFLSNSLQETYGYTFVGQNWLTVAEGTHTIGVAEQDRITVQEGDFVGVYYGVRRGQVTMENCTDSSEGIVVQSTSVYDHTDFTIGTSYVFGSYLSCRRFNVNATMSVTQQPFTGTDMRAFIGSGPELHVPTGGVGAVREWHYNSLSGGDVAFQVWRRVSDTSYTLVGQNLVTVSAGSHTIEVGEQDRLTVQDGDMIGVYYGANRGQVTMEDCDNPSDGTVLQTTAPYNHTDFTKGTAYPFEKYMSCKIFNVNTTLTVANNDVTIRAGDRRGGEKKVFTGSISDLYIPADGQIVEWQYHCLRTGPVAFQIWRRNTETNYTFVDQNFVTAEEGFHNLTINKADRITAHKGDFIGIYYAPNRGQVSLFNCASPSEGNVVKSTQYPDENFVQGQWYPFGPSITCKRFNLKAIIQVN